jgi:hypothetical protein
MKRFTHRILLIAALQPVLAYAQALVLSPLGYGEVRFGTKLSEVETKLKQLAEPRTRELGCDFVKFNRYPGIQFMVEEGVVTRADAESTIPNSVGVSVGMTLSAVKSLHPSVQIEPHKYDDEGHYLVLLTSDGRYAFVFEEGEGKVTDVRAGTRPSVEYVEGCL